MTIGEIVRRERKAKGLSIRKFAAKAGIDPKTVMNIEKYGKYPQFGTLKLIAKALDTTPQDIAEEAYGLK